MESYKRLCYKQREEIYLLKQNGFSKKQISIKLGYHKASIGREIKCNSHPDIGYLPDRAQD